MGTKNVTDESFENEVLKASKPTLVDFWAEWCGPCKQLDPILEEIASENIDKLKIFKLNKESFLNKDLYSSQNCMLDL